jgi:hypothetical protein
MRHMIPLCFVSVGCDGFGEQTAGRRRF